jgi:hypothetical protein
MGESTAVSGLQYILSQTRKICPQYGFANSCAVKLES